MAIWLIALAGIVVSREATIVSTIVAVFFSMAMIMSSASARDIDKWEALRMLVAFLVAPFSTFAFAALECYVGSLVSTVVYPSGLMFLGPATICWIGSARRKKAGTAPGKELSPGHLDREHQFTERPAATAMES
jgi:hypothetical protein